MPELSAGRRSPDYGDVSVWIEQQDTVHLKAADEHGDPVELTAGELKSLIDELTRLHAIVNTRN